MLSNSSILITGGTGSFGNVFIPMTLAKYNPRKIIVFSRDEMKQWEMAKRIKDDRVRFFIGDVRDKDRLYRALNGVDYVVHAAAIKIVPSAEYNPFECIKTNITGAMNLIDACIDRGVKRCVALSTDKASQPVNLYGATKLCSDKLFISGNFYSNNIENTCFAIVRYGNVMGSRGSVIPLFIEQARTGLLTITDERMTRFMITLEQAVELVWHAFDDMQGGEIYIKKIPSMKLLDIAKAVSENFSIRIIGIRPGEKLHEQMIGIEDASYTYEYNNYYKIIPQSIIQVYNQTNQKDNYIDNYIDNGKKTDSNFSYTSDTNNLWMSVEELRDWIAINKGKLLVV